MNAVTELPEFSIFSITWSHCDEMISWYYELSELILQFSVDVAMKTELFNVTVKGLLDYVMKSEI